MYKRQVLLNATGAMASASLVGMERSTVVMRAGLAGAVATIVLTPVLVLGLEPMPSLGLAGAGIALLVGLLPVLVLAIAADGLQAVSGFGLTGLKRSGRSFVVFAVVYGALALAALPVGAAFGLLGLWGAVAAANVLLVIGQAGAFWRATEQLAPPRCEPSKD